MRISFLCITGRSQLDTYQLYRLRDQWRSQPDTGHANANFSVFIAGPCKESISKETDNVIAGFATVRDLYSLNTNIAIFFLLTVCEQVRYEEPKECAILQAA